MIAGARAYGYSNYAGNTPKTWHANGNTVTIAGGTANGGVAGGYVKQGKSFAAADTEYQANKNTVTISGGTVSDGVYGGYAVTANANAKNGHASSNTVTLSGGKISGDVYGGYAKEIANTVETHTEQVPDTRLVEVPVKDKDGNPLKDENGNIRTEIVKEEYMKTVLYTVTKEKDVGPMGTASGNEIVLKNGTNALDLTDANLYGGHAATVRDNTLTVDSVKDITAASVNNFNTYNFVIDDTENVKSGNTMLTVTSDTNLGDAAVNVHSTGTAIKKGDKIVLLKSNGKLTWNGEVDKTNTNDAQIVTIETVGDVKKVDNSLVLYVDGLKYAFDLIPTTKDGDTFLTSSNAGETAIDAKDVTVTASGATLSAGDTVTLLKKTAGTLKFTGGSQEVAPVFSNDAKTATITTKGTVGQKDNKLVLTVNGVTYHFDLTAATAKDGQIFLKSQNAGETKVSGADVKLDDTALQGVVLSLNKDDTITLLQNTTDDGTIAYTSAADAKDEPKLDHTCSTDAGDASIHTTGTVKTSDDKKNLVLQVDDVKYHFDLAPDVADKKIFFTSADTGETKIDAADVTVTTSGAALSKGDTLTLRKNAGTLKLTGDEKEKGVDVTYKNDKTNPTATIHTTGTLGASADGKDLVLNIGNVAYDFTITPSTKDKDTLLTSKNAGQTTIDVADVTVNADGIPTLNEGDTVYLLKDTAGTLTVTGTKAANFRTYTNQAGNASIAKKGTVLQSGNDLVLSIGDVLYTFDLSSATPKGYTFLTSEETGAAKLTSANVALEADGMLALSKGDALTLMKGGVDTYRGAKTLDHTYQNEANTASVRTTGLVEQRGRDLVLGVDDVTYDFTLSDGVKDGAAFLTTENPGLTKIDAADVTIRGGAGVHSLAEGDTVYLLKNSAAGTLSFTGTKDVGLGERDYQNTEKTAYNATAGTVAKSGQDLVLSVGGKKCFFQLTPGIQNGSTYIRSADAGEMKLDGSDLAFEGANQLLSFNKGDTVTLLEKDAGKLVYTGKKTLDDTYTCYNDDGAKTATVRTTGTVAQDGNKLNLGVTNVKYHFFLPDGTKNEDVLLNIATAGETRIDDAEVSASGDLDLNKTDKVYLVKKTNGTLAYAAPLKNVTLNIGVSAKQVDATIDQEANDLVMNVTNVRHGLHINAETKVLVEPREAQSSLINMGSDFLLNVAMEQLKNAPDTAYDDGYTAFGGASGTARMRYATGSHVDLNGAVMNAGIAKRHADKTGTFTWGAFFETGSGNYDSYLGGGTHGSGSTRYTGGGLLARQDNANGSYVEGSLHYGRTKADCKAVLEGIGATSYDTSSNYIGGHVGLGRVLKLSENNSLDVYGKYLLSRTGGDSARLSTEDPYRFDAVTSHRLLLGARFTHDEGKTGKGYLGLAYQYEFGGDARAHWQGYALPSPSTQGSSVRFDLGWTFQQTPTTPLALDLGISASTGKVRGIGFHAGVNVAF